MNLSWEEIIEIIEKDKRRRYTVLLLGNMTTVTVEFTTGPNVPQLQFEEAGKVARRLLKEELDKLELRHVGNVLIR